MDRNVGCASQAKATTRTKPNGTRSLATKSAYGLENQFIYFQLTYRVRRARDSGCTILSNPSNTMSGLISRIDSAGSAVRL